MSYVFGSISNIKNLPILFWGISPFLYILRMSDPTIHHSKLSIPLLHSYTLLEKSKEFYYMNTGNCIYIVVSCEIAFRYIFTIWWIIIYAIIYANCNLKVYNFFIWRMKNIFLIDWLTKCSNIKRVSYNIWYAKQSHLQQTLVFSQRGVKNVLEDGKLLLPKNLRIIAINQMIIIVLKSSNNIQCGISMMNDILIIMSCWDLSKTHTRFVTSLQYIMSFLILHWSCNIY